MEQRYLVLMGLKEKELVKKEDRFIRRYIKEKKCDCVDKVLPNEILNCKHLRKAIRKEFDKEIKLLWNYTVNAIADDLVKINVNPNRFKI